MKGNKQWIGNCPFVPLFPQNTCLMSKGKGILYTDLLSFEMSFTKARAIALFYLVALPYKNFASKIFIKEALYSR